jgi:shikimate kinase
MNSFYIIIRGPLGIGKTTISKKLAELLNAKYFSFDKILKENGLDKVDDNFTPQDFVKANKIVLPDIKKTLEDGQIVILDGCFYFKEQITHLEKNIDSPLYIFTLKAPLKTCIDRDSKRKKVYGKIAAKEVYELVSKVKIGKIVNTKNKTIQEVIGKIITLIK